MYAVHLTVKLRLDLTGRRHTDMTTWLPPEEQKRYDMKANKVIAKTKITEVFVEKKWIEDATSKAQSLGVLKNSISKGKGNLIGFVGEYAVLSFIKDGHMSNTYDYDITTPTSTIDVKTKGCSSVPLDHYQCSIAAYNTKQKCSHYAFVRMFYDFEKCWVLGWIEKEKYFDEAKFLKQGEEDGDNGYIVKADCYNLPIKKLNDIEFFS